MQGCCKHSRRRTEGTRMPVVPSSLSPDGTAPRRVRLILCHGLDSGPASAARCWQSHLSLPGLK